MRALGSVVLLACLGCLDPDDIFPMKGTVVSAAGPVAAQSVELRRASQPAYVNDCSDATPFKSTVTDDAGAYGFELFRAQAQRLTGGLPFCFRLQTRFESGVEAAADLLFVEGPTTVPPLPDWNPALELVPFEEDGGTSGWNLQFRPVVDMPSRPDDAERLPRHRATLLTADGAVAWEAVAPNFITEVVWPPPPLRISRDALEDFSTQLHLVGRSVTSFDTEAGEFGRFPIDTPLEVTAPQRVTLQGSGTPASRGADCTPLPSPCPLTDGLLTPVQLPAGTIEVVIALPRPMLVRSVLVRGVSSTTSVVVGAADETGTFRFLAQRGNPALFWPEKYASNLPTSGPTETAPNAVRRQGFIEVPVADMVSTPVSSVRVSFLDVAMGAPEAISISEISVFEQ